ncbi:ankyrin repeat domain-containing protein [Quatrionicoccus australiensis]|uniref:ankyrin repeat domain-containing protein n=1 Tax=Quatrionicoccus australiensis TaxID=138118 RepID=UPI001CFA1B88|nr:ankyrin repeat domain-containing protein [Quatrionicoccus australiensis]MCB4361439.1 ankyrin repeat domain-containing protein [Quatrionicoccus australiensis]
MAHLPTFEEMLNEVHTRLGLKALPNKLRFTGYEMEVDGHVNRIQSLLQQIFDALELDESARRDALRVVEKLGGILKAIELKTWTGNASQQQVLWHTLACIHVPVWARNIAFWSQANTEHDLPPIDAGMPGGEFWFLPSGDPETGEVKLPITKVIEWLLDLLAAPSVDDLSIAIGNKNLREREGGNDAAVRTLRNWLAGVVPNNAEKIEEVFPNDASLSFVGALAFDEAWTTDEQFENALKFVVDHRRLSVEQISEQIPMKPERLCLIFDGSASDNEKETFVRNIAIRYAAPDMATVRQRLRVARLAQAGYQDLVKYLCPELQPEQAHDPKQNKVLQLISLFETIYNKSIQASSDRRETEAEQDEWFEAQFPPLSFYDRLLVIQPSLDWPARVSLLAERLTRHFLLLQPKDGLEDFVAAKKEEWVSTLKPWLKRIQSELEEDKSLEILREKVRAGSPKRAMQAINSFWVLSQFVQSKGLTDWIRQCALERMKELAASPLEQGSVRLLELGFLLNVDPRLRPKDTREQVQVLLDAAQADTKAWEQWKAPLLRFRAKHALFESRAAEAEKDFKAALEACSERAYGGLRGEIARDGFATAIVRGAFNPKNHAPYYRNMLHFMEFPNGVPSFEDAATECEGFFGTTLYQPYPGVEPFEGPGKANFVAIVEETFGLIETANWDGLRDWMAGNARHFREDNLKDARRSSVLMQWLKLLHEFENKMPMMRSMVPPQLLGGFGKAEAHMQNRREAIRLLLEAWPEQARIADFKKQTPLMLAADNGSADLTRLLVPLSDINAQDYLGRTALHAAVAGLSSPCLGAVLDANPDVLKVSEGEGNTALHTAVRFAWLIGVRMIVEAYPGLAGHKNAEGLTPLDMARGILENYEDWLGYMREQKKRQMGTKEELQEIVALLDMQTIH